MLLPFKMSLDNFLKLLSIPMTSKPFLQKKFTDSEPTRPVEPVIITTDILDKYINLFLSKELFYQLFF